MAKSSEIKVKKPVSENQVFKQAEVIQSTQSYQWQDKLNVESQAEVVSLETLRMNDIEWRLKNRQSFRNFLFGLLIIQNVVVFGLFGWGLYLNRLIGLENVFSVLIGGTLLETTSLIYIIVKWLFSEIPYENRKDGMVKSDYSA